MKKLSILIFCLFNFMMTFSNFNFANEQKVAVMYDERFLLHNTGPSHPENPERLISVISDLKANQDLAILKILSG